jgi:hypothetical protein
MDWRLTAGLLGVALTLFGVASLFVPALLGPVPGQQTTVDSASNPATFVSLAAVAAVVATLVVRAATAGTGEPSGSPATRFTDDPPASTTDQTRVAAEQLDVELEQAVRRGGDQLAAVRSRLRSTAVDVYAGQTGLPRDRAERAVERGEWTDDDVAARFLADERRLSLSQVWLLVAPTRERRRRIERTIVAVERLQGER